jgi:hypothetical protein
MIILYEFDEEKHQEPLNDGLTRSIRTLSAAFPAYEIITAPFVTPSKEFFLKFQL